MRTNGGVFQKKKRTEQCAFSWWAGMDSFNSEELSFAHKLEASTITKKLFCYLCLLHSSNSNTMCLAAFHLRSASNDGSHGIAVCTVENRTNPPLPQKRNTLRCFLVEQ